MHTLNGYEDVVGCEKFQEGYVTTYGGTHGGPPGPVGIAVTPCGAWSYRLSHTIFPTDFSLKFPILPG